MHNNRKPVLFTIGLYAAAFAAIFITDKMYVSRGANDITGPPFIVAVLCFAVIVFFFCRSIYQAIAKSNSYWMVVAVHILLLLLFFFIFMM